MSSLKSILSEADRQSTFVDIVRGLAELLKPKPRLNVWQWAERYRQVARGVSAKTLEGSRLYRTADAPHQREPQETPTDPRVQATILVMASQVGGKTEIFNNVLGYHMHWQPRSSVVMYPQLDAAEKYSKKKFTPMVEASPVLSAILRPARTRDSGNTILTKDFRGGSVYFVGANSPASLRGASGAVLLGDEIDSNPPSAGEEGDPIELLFKRGESFPGVVKLLASTPTIKGVSRIWEWFELSDQRYWFVPCVRCGAYQVLYWRQVQWPKGRPEKAVLVCSACSAALEDKQRLEMYHNGQWRPTAPFRGIAGFHLNGIYTPWPAQKGFANRLHQMAEEFLRAERGGEQKLKVWTNTFDCTLWENKSEAIDPNKLLDRAEDYSPAKIPEGVIVIFCSVDVQKSYLQLESVGLGLDDESWGIETRKIEGDTEQDDVWDDLALHLQKAYVRVDGPVIPISATTIDMRHRPHKVRKFVQRSGIPRVYPVYGVGKTISPIFVTSRFNKHYRLRTFAVSSRLGKDMIFARLKVEEEGPRFMHFPKGQGYNQDYFEQLTAEVLTVQKIKGVTIESYEKIRDRNEALDIRVYFLAGIDILKPAVGIIDRHLRAGHAAQSQKRDYDLKPDPPAGDSRPTPAPKAPGARKRIKLKMGGGFNSGPKC